MSTLAYPMIACVGYPTHEMFEYIKHNNMDKRVYNILDVWDDSNSDAIQFRPMMYDYIQRDPSVRQTTKQSLEQHRDNFQDMSAEVTDPEAIKELFRSFHNFYFDYIESIKFILDEVCVLIPYPLTSNKTINFDHYIILEQDESRIIEDYSSNPALALQFEMIRSRIAEVKAFVPQEKVTRITVPYNAYDRSKEVSAPVEVLKSIINACTEITENYRAKLLDESLIDSNPQSSNSTS